MAEREPFPFIFGPLDGKTLFLPPDAQWYEITEPEDLTPNKVYADKPPAMWAKRILYRRRMIGVGNYVLQFFSLHELKETGEWSVFFALKRMLENYACREERERMLGEQIHRQNMDIAILRNKLARKHDELKKLRQSARPEN